jgi:UDP-N-acetylmuramoylalanine--D-glutamate ligase
MDGHRIATVGTLGGVTYVDDSKATNPHAARMSLLAYDSVVWIAGGLAKGAHFDELVESARDRLRAAVLIGRDRDVVAQALARHAPDVPVITLDPDETGTGHAAMEHAVVAARDLAQPGDTVLLAPGCASMDLFENYADRGDAFAEAVRRLTS